jgi:hypothetical protein
MLSKIKADTAIHLREAIEEATTLNVMVVFHVRGTPWVRQGIGENRNEY